MDARNLGLLSWVMLAVFLGLVTGIVLGNLVVGLTLALASGGLVLVLANLRLK
ncbi:MAG: hypothetical protein OXF22_03590 [Anaerolineaceae bacterium]|nr:hypothetical protein [Anaerolineaceae bacterium]